LTSQSSQTELATNKPVTLYAVIMLMFGLLFLFYMRIYLFELESIVVYFIIKFIKILPVGTEMFHVNGRTGRHDEANSRNFSKAPKD
jgi:hypothetical protein